MYNLDRTGIPSICYRRQFQLILKLFFLMINVLKEVNQRFEHNQVTYTDYTLLFSQFSKISSSKIKIMQ